MRKKKAGKKKESKEEDDQRQGSTRSGVKYQPRTSEPSAEREAAICTKGHLNPRELAAMRRDYGQEKGEDWWARITDDEEDETGLAARAQQPIAQDTSDEPHTAVLSEEGNETDLDEDEEPPWGLYGRVQNESHPTWTDTSSGKREFDSEWDDWTYERRCNDEAHSGDTCNEELWAWLQHLIAQSNMTEEERRRLGHGRAQVEAGRSGRGARRERKADAVREHLDRNDEGRRHVGRPNVAAAC
jgi:hypothetical protein